ncbi:MAG: hypothetical protein A2175_00450 [Candidatus Nealsonbacteria bacterium RBG_13_42_11]|uniref:Uncharacterized protein n=1 Tax=Candidatus Nealsonbacteria bacterium RBG_13_42_11 TaxID=1801663 RepID=A0A1G2DYQ8_9BACT|nr:MAG: hypothetical protein A2175_00450 [Candidatus Nealsonbacteria bacterium RBG_13_42_11]
MNSGFVDINSILNPSNLRILFENALMIPALVIKTIWSAWPLFIIVFGIIIILIIIRQKNRKN